MWWLNTFSQPIEHIPVIIQKKTPNNLLVVWITSYYSRWEIYGERTVNFYKTTIGSLAKDATQLFLYPSGIASMQFLFLFLFRLEVFNILSVSIMQLKLISEMEVNLNNAI